MTKTLKTKQGSEWTNDLGQTFPAQTLYRYVDEKGEGGCWFTTLERAERSWTLWVAGAERRTARRAETQRHLAAIAAADLRNVSVDPFARFGA